ALGADDGRVPREGLVLHHADRIARRRDHVARLIAARAALVMVLPFAVEAVLGVGAAKIVEDFAESSAGFGREIHGGVDVGDGLLLAALLVRRFGESHETSET